MIHFSPRANFHLGLFFSTNKYVSPGPWPQNRLEWIPRMIFPFFYPNILHHKNEYIPNTIVTCKIISGGGCNTFPELEIAKSEFLTHLRILREVIFRLFYHRFQIILHSNILEYGTLRIYDRPCFWHQKSEKSECFGNISKSTSTLTIIWKFLLYTLVSNGRKASKKTWWAWLRINGLTKCFHQSLPEEVEDRK